MIPDPQRIESELLHLHAVLDQLTDIRHFRIGGKVADSNAEGAAQSGHTGSPYCEFRALADVVTVGVKGPQHREFVCGGRLGYADVLVELELEARVILNLFACDAGIERKRLDTSCDRIKTEHRKISHHAVHAADRQSALGPRMPTFEPARAGDEIDVLDEAPLLVLHDDDHVGKARNVVAPASAR